ncbi:hypothetical protein DFH29DRAFT_999976 [Suillus ampliporus]|nr:hypothetical protein DFH29DRAFT_999976 [Suillus ampliporus]
MLPTPWSTLVLHRGLALLNCVLKEFSGIKMLTGIIDQLHDCTADNLIVAHLIYKCLAKMALWLWPRLIKPDKGRLVKLKPWFLQLFQSSTGQLKILSELRINIVLALRGSGASDRLTLLSVDRLTRHVRIFGKKFHRLQQLEPAKFVKLPTGNKIVLYYWDRVVQAINGPPELIQDTPSTVFPVHFLLQAMVLFKENLARWMPFHKGGPKTEISIDCLWELWSFADESRPALSQEFVEDAIQLLMSCFIPLNPADLKGWMSDPEEWVNLEYKENNQWEYELRTVDFDIDVFAPYLPAAATELVKLMGEVDTMEVKQHLAKSLNVVIECAGPQITPHTQMISEGIPQLWTAAGEEWLFKAQLLVVMTSLISVAINLDEDVLNLWLAAVRNSSSLSCAGGPSLIDLVPLAVSLLSNNLDLLGPIASIVKSFLFVNAPAILQSSAMLLTECVYLLARIALADRQMFLQLVSATAQTTNLPKAKILEAVVDHQLVSSSAYYDDNYSSRTFHRASAMLIQCLSLPTFQPNLFSAVHHHFFIGHSRTSTAALY